MANYKHTKHDYGTDLKKCSQCGEEFPRTPEFFYREKRSNDGLSYLCKQCKKKIDVASREKNADKFKAYQKSPQFVYSSLKYQAKKRGMPFAISFDFYVKNIADEPCFYCGSEDTKHWADRFVNDHAIGYTEENTVPCCELCNKMKSHRPPEVFISHCLRVADFYRAQKSEEGS